MPSEGTAEGTRLTASKLTNEKKGDALATALTLEKSKKRGQWSGMEMEDHGDNSRWKRRNKKKP